MRKIARDLLAYNHVLSIHKVSFNQFFGNTVSSICNEQTTRVANNVSEKCPHLICDHRYLHLHISDVTETLIYQRTTTR